MNKTKNKAVFGTQNRAPNSKPQAKCLTCFFIVPLFCFFSPRLISLLKMILNSATEKHVPPKHSLKMRKQYPQILLCWLETSRPALRLNWHGSGLPTRETQIQFIVCILWYKLTNHLYLYSQNTTKVISMHTYNFNKLLSYVEYRVCFKKRVQWLHNYIRK